MLRETMCLARVTVIALAILFSPVSSFAAVPSKGVKPINSAKPSKPAPKPISIEERIANLQPGRFVWQPQRATSGSINIVVSLPLQIAYVFRGSTLIGASTVSTGKAGHDTPPGRFRILQKSKDHRSNLYNDSPMPFMQRLTWDGIALHAGAIPGRPASRGCVRLPMEFANALYDATQLGVNVIIVEQAPSSEAAYAMVQGRTFATAMGGPEEEAPASKGSPALKEVFRIVKALKRESR